MRSRSEPSAAVSDAVVEQARRSWGSSHRDDPYPLLAALRQEGPVQRVTLADGHEAHLVLTRDEALAALADPRLSKDMDAAFATGDVVDEGVPGRDFARHMLAVDPPDHTRLRRLFSRAFSSARIEALRPRVRRIAEDLVDDVVAASDEPVDLVAGLALPLPFTVICTLLGLAEEERPRLQEGLRDFLVPGGSEEAQARSRRGAQIVVDVLLELIETRRAAPGDDLTSALITARDGGQRLDERELRSSLLQMVLAGYHTTTALIGNSVVALLDHPAQLAALRRRPERIPEALEELLRYDPPVPHTTFRYAIEPLELGGVTIPAGSQVLVSLAAVCHDPRHVEYPGALDLDRDTPRHLAFGHGIHFCIGARLARLEGIIALTTLLRRTRSLRLAVERDELRWDHGDGIVLRSLTALPVWVEPAPGPATTDEQPTGRHRGGREPHHHEERSTT